jgi:hypothetical protein
LIDANGAATLSSRLAVTLSRLPTRNSAAVTAADPAGEEEKCEDEGADDLAAAVVPPHRQRRGEERARRIAGDEERAHVVGREHRADEDRDDEEDRPRIAQEREPRGAAACEPLGHRPGAQKEEPGRAEDEPDAAELRRQLAQVGEGDAEREHRAGRCQHQQHGDAGGAVATIRSLDRLAADREDPGEAARQRSTREHHDREREHRQPQVALVVEREIAVGAVAAEREVE